MPDCQQTNQIPLLDDTALLATIAGGDAEAFASFYDRYSSLLFTVAQRILGDEQEAEEVLQEAAVRIWESAPNYRAELGKPVSWAVVITRNQAIDRLRSLQRKRDGAARLTALAEPSSCPEPTAAPWAVYSHETARQVQQALAALPAEQRQAIELAFLRGLSQNEIAQQLDQPLGTIKARIRRGMIAMRENLEEPL